MKDTSSCVERVLHRTAQQGSSRTNVSLLSILEACPGTTLLNGQTNLVFNFSNVASQGWPGKRISLIKHLWLKFQGFVLAKVAKARKPNQFEIKIAVLKASHIHHNTSASQRSHPLYL